MELISREEVLNALNEICNHALKVYSKKYHLPIRTIMSTAIGDIKKLPSQWVEINEVPFGKVYQNSFVTFLSTETYDEIRRRLHRLKGEWQASTEGTDYRVCSICNYTRHAGTKYNFCPKCGADMRGEE